MPLRNYLYLFIVAFLFFTAIAHFQTLPGYMDADYYFAGALQLVNGKGFIEPYIWNYLGDPQSLPVPSHAYWMPLASIIAALGMKILRSTSYEAGRMPFIFLSACVPLITAKLAFAITKNSRVATSAGFLAIFCHYYAPFMPVPDNYAPFMLLGASFFLLLLSGRSLAPLWMGLVAGLLALARNDGTLWLVISGLILIFGDDKKVIPSAYSKSQLRRCLNQLMLLALGYFVIMGPWYFRNFQVLGSIFTPGANKLLWLTKYQDTFIYPPSLLTFSRFINQGWPNIVADRLNALQSNLDTALFAQCGAILAPFVFLGLWKLRSELSVKVAILTWGSLFVLMSVVFPFAGARGSFHHAAAAIQPMLWVGTAVGVEQVLQHLRARSLFCDRGASLVFQSITLFIAALFTVSLVQTRVVLDGWAHDDASYFVLEKKLQDLGISDSETVMVDNPPGYFVVAGRPAIRTPLSNDLEMYDLARKFSVRYVVLEKRQFSVDPNSLQSKLQVNPNFELLASLEEAQLFKLK